MNFVDIITARRNGEVQKAPEFEFLCKGAVDGSIPDYQLSAWLMAAFLNPLTPLETADLTLAMANSGERVDLEGLPRPWVDKHSTGGVGDKTTLILLPILAAMGLTVTKMSGRGLGITGGTIDKLESVPGFNVGLSPEQLKSQALKFGVALTGQTPKLAPADKVLYALRDVTATVPSIPLIVSSILSKKIAGGAEIILLDVKCGSGAFMRDFEQAKELKFQLEETGLFAQLKVKASITDMSQPLGCAVGNALEVKEAIRVLSLATEGLNANEQRVKELCVAFAVESLQASGRDETETEVLEAIASGLALENMKEWFSAQGADMTVFENEDWERAAVVREFKAEAPGFATQSDAGQIGEIALQLGAGRRTKEDAVNHSVGLRIPFPVGSKVASGDVLAEVHAATESDAEAAMNALQSAIICSEGPVSSVPLFLEN